MAKYDPSKQYSWENDEQIVISGRDFGLFLNTFRTILGSNSPLPVPVVVMANKANDAIEEIMISYIEKDVIKEVSDSPKMQIKK